MGKVRAICVIAGLVVSMLTPAIPAAPQAAAQGTASAAEEKKAAEFARLYRAWQHTKDPEQQIAQLEELIKLEPALKRWPLVTPRARARGELLLALGYACQTRIPGGSAENLEKAIGAYQAALAVFTAEALPREWATTQIVLGTAYQSRILGGSAENLEKAIGAYRAALTVFTREAHPGEWAEIQVHLGNAYAERILGDQADNIEKAISAYQAALTVRTREALPRQWAETQINLGAAYERRIAGDPADNLEKTIGAFRAALTVFTREAQPREWATTQDNLGVAYLGRSVGDRADNLEKAIGAFELALTVRTRQSLPREWATTQIGLGNAYQSRILGDRADNLEKVIDAYRAALTVRTREALPRDWAEAQVNLGNAYEQRILGDRGDNLEKAIDAYQAALTVRTREALPRDWAEAQVNLGNAYEQRILGDRADNLEKAIGAYQAALTVRTREALPREWTETQNNLGLAYQSRILGDRADNLEKAIGTYQAALTVRTREALPREWAGTQSNLGNAYQARILGDRTDNLEEAIGAYQAALTVFTRKVLPREWAGTQSNLGLAYQARVLGDRGDNLEKAIDAYRAALTTTTREANPRDWAETQINLGNAYQVRVLGDRADNLEKAINAYEAALTVTTRDANPRGWATTQNNLGIAYERRTLGDRADNVERAIGAYQAALMVFTREALPRDHLRTGLLLGGALVEAREWRGAALAYANAREAFLLLFGQGLNDAEARHLIDEAGPLFAEAAFAAAQRGEFETALALADEGRARQLRVALRRQALDLPAEKRPRHDALTAELRGWQRLAESAQGTAAIDAWERLETLRKELGELTAPHLGSQAALTAALVPEGGAIVAPIITRFGGKLLLVTADLGRRRTTAVHLPQVDSARLNTLMRGDGTKVGARGGWLGAYQIQYLKGRELEERFPEWIGTLNKIGPDLWALFGEALDRAFQERGVKPGGRIVLLPAGSLGLLPLGLAQDPASGQRLGDIYEIVHAPSLEALAAASRQLADPPPPSLAVTINPTGDLPLADLEGKLVAAHFARMSSSSNVIDRSSARPKIVVAALEDRSYWHFASHGRFDWNDVRTSGLMMRDQETLSIGQLLDTEGRLGRPRLAVLSACETGLYDIDRNPEEFVGLPATFLQIGAAGVVSSLWPVDDLATALLIAKFYDLHMQDRLAPPTALKDAQAWLREATRAELIAYARTAAARAKLDPAKLAAIETDLTSPRRAMRLRIAAPPSADGVAAPAPLLPERGDPGDTDRMQSRPFWHPYFWGGFTYTGL